MSDWGKIAFYYDYEKEDKVFGMQRIRGLISKSHCYPGVDGMILYAYNGIRYFLFRNKGRCNFDRTKYDGVKNAWVALDRAFEIIFELGVISPATDDVKDTYENERITDKSIRNDLFNCEGLYGWLFIKYTGNEKDGYTLKYGYFYGNRQEYSVKDLRSVYETKKEEIAYYGEKVVSLVEEAVAFFEENAVLMSAEEFWGIEDLAIEWYKHVFW